MKSTFWMTAQEAENEIKSRELVALRSQVIGRCKFELATNFDCPSEQILGVYGNQIDLDSRQMFELLASLIN